MTLSTEPAPPPAVPETPSVIAPLTTPPVVREVASWMAGVLALIIGGSGILISLVTMSGSVLLSLMLPLIGAGLGATLAGLGALALGYPLGRRFTLAFFTIPASAAFFLIPMEGRPRLGEGGYGMLTLAFLGVMLIGMIYSRCVLGFGQRSRRFLGWGAGLSVFPIWPAATISLMIGGRHLDAALLEAIPVSLAWIPIGALVGALAGAEYLRWERKPQMTVDFSQDFHSGQER